MHTVFKKAGTPTFFVSFNYWPRADMPAHGIKAQCSCSYAVHTLQSAFCMRRIKLMFLKLLILLSNC